MQSALFGDITQRGTVVPCRRFGTTSVPSSSILLGYLKMWPIGFPETSVRNYHSKLSRIPKQCRSQVLLRSQHFVVAVCFEVLYMDTWSHKTLFCVCLRAVSIEICHSTDLLQHESTMNKNNSCMQAIQNVKPFFFI
jgi:hypothetical protein